MATTKSVDRIETIAAFNDAMPTMTVAPNGLIFNNNRAGATMSRSHSLK